MTTKKRTKAPTPVIDAVIAGDRSRLQTVLEAGGDMDERDREGDTALHHACMQNREDLVDCLLTFKAQVGLANNDGWTPLHFAAGRYEATIARKLLRAGALVDAADAHGNTPLSRATFESRGRGDMITLLLDSGADRDRKNNHGVSPAALAANIANFNVAQWFKR